MTKLALLLLLNLSAAFAALPDYKVKGNPAAPFVDEDDVMVLIETTTRTITTTSTTTTATTTTEEVITATGDGYEFTPSPSGSPPGIKPTPAVWKPTEVLPSTTTPLWWTTQAPTTTTTTTKAAPVAPVPIAVLVPAPTPAPAPQAPSIPDLLFVVDASGSVRSSWHRQLECIFTISASVLGRSKVGVVVYSSRLKHRLVVPFAIYSDFVSFKSMINAIEFHGGVTLTGEGLIEALRVLQREKPRSAAVITLTDGYSWDALDIPSGQIRSINGISTYAIALEAPFVQKELEVIAGSPNRVFTTTDSCERLARIIAAGTITTPTVPRAVPSTVASTTTVPQTFTIRARKPSRAPSMPSTVSIEQEKDKYAQFSTAIFPVDSDPAEDSVRISMNKPILTTSKDNADFVPHRNRLRTLNGNSQDCSLDVIFVFDTTSRAGLKNLLVSSQILIHSNAIKNRNVRIAAVKFGEGIDSHVVFALDDTSRVHLDSVANQERKGGDRGLNSALSIVAALFRGATPTKLTRRIVIVLSDDFDKDAVAGEYADLEYLEASIFILHSSPRDTLTSHTFPGTTDLKANIISPSDIRRVEMEMERVAVLCSQM